MRSEAARRWLVLTIGVVAGWELCLFRFFSVNRLATPLSPFWGVADDVYISADFARTFANGQGLTWYAGAPRVEGFSNPLWVLILAAIHRLPRFSEDHLGLYVLALNSFVVCALALTFVRGVRRVLEATSLSGQSPSGLRIALALTLALCGGASLLFSTALGFETGLTTLLAFTAFEESLRPAETIRLWKIAVLTGLAFWTRMDGLLLCGPALLSVAFRVRPGRRMAGAAALVGAMLAAELLARHAYYGEWLPNTYYLKATGWAFGPRVSQGVFFAAVPLSLTVLLVFPLWALVVRRLRDVAIPVSLACLGYVSMLAYSIDNGGDLLVAFGYDRFSGMGAVFLTFTLVVVVLRTPARGARASLLALAGLSLATGPAWILRPREAAETLVHFFDPTRPVFPTDPLLQLWVYQGKLFREIVDPEARVALCGAGAFIYFSHLGGVDVLGKVEPLVAHEPVPDRAPPEARCWRGFPGAGHNKEDLRAVFAARHPELSLIQPPDRLRRFYLTLSYGPFPFWALKKTPYLRWNRVRILK